MTAHHTEPGGRLEISVSVVTHNNEQCLDALLASLSAQKGISWEAFFFDNASADRTPALIANAGAGTLHLSEVNVGYGRGHNHNLAHCRGRYVLILNPDLTFGPGVFAGLAAHLDHHPLEAIAGPRVLEGADHTPFPPRRFYPGEGMVALDPIIRRPEIAWINGCCMIARRSVLEELGGFDEDFFLYQAETDLCLRARKAGFSLGHAVFWRKHYSSRDGLQMARFQYLVSRWLLVLEKLPAWLPSLPPSLSEDRLRARRDVCKEFLEKEPRRGRRISDSARILSRQSKLALEWVRQGRFPLDDY